MSQEAIGNADVSAQEADLAAAEQGAVVEQEKTERQLQTEAIARRRAEQVANENQEAVAQGLLPAPQEKPADADALADAPIYKKDGKWFTKTKIDGKEQEVPFDSVVRTFQKNQSADVRLHQASETLRDAQARAKQIVDQAVIDAKNRHGKQPSSDGDAADEDVLNVVERAFSELVEGSPKEGAKLLAQVLGRQKATPQGEAVDIRGQVAEVVTRMEEHRALVSAVENFRKNHPDLAGDPLLHSMVDKESELLLSDPEFQGASPADVLEESARRVKERITTIASRTAASTDRLQRKVAAAAPGPGTTARRPQPQQPQPPTVAQKLAAMRAARGQA